MGVGTVRKTDLRGQLKAALGGSHRPLMIHTDLLALGTIEKLRSREEMLKDTQELFLETTAQRPLIIPTFNYTFCQSRVFDVANDPSQVGSFSEYIRLQRFPRTLTPVFNFCLVQAEGFEEAKPNDNTFNEHSTFGKLGRADGEVAFLGAPLSANTFVHHVEEMANVGYRYPKHFRGSVISAERRFEVDLVYRVCPRLGKPLRYDWDALESDLLSKNILRTYPLGRGRCLIYRCQELYDYWRSLLRREELALLDSRSKSDVYKWYSKFGRPLTFEKLEKPA